MGNVTGGAGGDGGGSALIDGRPGGGGAGGNAIDALLAHRAEIQNSGLITGGAGGNSFAASGDALNFRAGSGGAGVALGGSNLINRAGATIRGGASGSAGASPGMSFAAAEGGSGVTVSDGTVTNFGNIAGGDGALGGAGVRMTGSGTLINDGHIAGGLSAGGAYGDAVRMEGDGGRLELRSGYQFAGAVRSTGNGNVLALGGLDNGAFDMSQLGSAYLGFTDLEKTGTSSWSLSGTPVQAVNWTVREGVLQFDEAAQLGGSGSTIALGDARLVYNGASPYEVITAALALTGSNGIIGVGSGASLVISQGVSGSSSSVLWKEGQGALRLDGPSTYALLAVTQGMVTLTDEALPQSIANQANVVIQTARDQTYSGDIQGLNGQDGLMHKYGPGMLTLTGTNVLDWNIQAGGISASANRFAGDVGVASGANFTLEDAANGSYAGRLSGAGAFTKRGAGTLTLTADSSAFTGFSSIEAGTLNMASNARLGGKVFVDHGGTLAGNGTVGAVDVLSGGTLSLAGGDFKVDGDAIFRSGSTLAVRADPNGAPGRLVVGGTADLRGGNVLHVGVGDGFAPSSQYTIVSAGQVQGRFASVSSQYAYLTAALDYSDPQAVNLQLVRRDVAPSPRPIRFDDLAVTPNQRAVGRALESLPQDNPLYRAVLTLPEGAPPQALAALSGEAHASTAGALTGLGANARAIPLAQLRRGLGAAFQPGAPTASAGASDAPLPASALPRSDTLPVWAQAVGQWQRSGGEDGVARVRQSTGGVYAGADTAIGGGWRLGGAVGVTNSKLKTDGLSSQSDIDSYSATVYGGRRFEAGAGHVNVLLGAAYTWHDISSRRNVRFTGIDEELAADYGASTGQVFGEVGYGLPVGGRVVLEPYAGLAFNDQRVRGFSESGGSAALSGERQHDQTTTTTLGLRGTVQWDAVALTAGAGWRYAFGDVNPRSTLAFAGSEAFAVAGAPIARNALAAELAGQWRASRNVAFTLAYDGEYGGGNQQHAGTLRMNWRF
ncbi:autotransporter domain-containing protein [Achromobacter denitrificans]